MRCPKCGAFLDDGKEICFMCGANVKTYVPNNNGNNFNVDSNFSNGNMNNSFNNNRFSNNVATQRETWKNVTVDDEKDIFDFYEEHKKTIRIILIVILIVALVFGGFKYYQYKTTPVPDTPVIGNLYYEVDSSFEDLSGSSSSGKQYTLSGDKGSDCTISITMASTTSENHVSEYFASVLEDLEPSRDKEGNIENELDVYSSQEKNVTIQDVTWYSLNVYYRKDLDSDFNILKHKYLAIVHNGYSYDIALANNVNSSQCNLSLDNFVRSLKFIDD